MSIKNLSDTIKAMMAAGCSTEQISAVLDVHSKSDEEAQDKKREKWKNDKRRRRMSTNVHLDASGPAETQVDKVDLPPSSSPSDGSPPTPIYKNYTPPSLTPSSSPPINIAHREMFEEFWSAYPRKVGKGKARSSWVKAVRSASPEVIIEAVRQTHWSSDPEYVPHPATWLNGERWLDEKPPPRLTMADRVAQQALETERDEQEQANQNILPFWRL